MERVPWILAVTAALLVVSTAYATPPNAIHAHYDIGRQELSVTIQHNVSDRKAHFVEKVVILKNGTQMASKEFDDQTSNRNQTMIPFRIPAAAGDTFTIIATCNRSGKNDATITVLGPSAKRRL